MTWGMGDLGLREASGGSVTSSDRVQLIWVWVMDTDPRFTQYGLAPQNKADYAFWLHELFHIKPDGIMTIVLPHGVLFRGGAEEAIRTRLIKAKNIDTIIGLPSSIFYGTGIPTIIMALKKQRSHDDVLFIDAPQGLIKNGKNNLLRARDIERIVDTVHARRDVERFLITLRDYRSTRAWVIVGHDKRIRAIVDNVLAPG